MLCDNERDVIRRGKLMDHPQSYLKRLCVNARIHVGGNKSQLAKRLYDFIGVTQHDLNIRPFQPPTATAPTYIRQPQQQQPTILRGIVNQPPPTTQQQLTMLRGVMNQPPTASVVNQQPTNKIEDISSLYYDGKQKEQALVEEVNAKKRTWSEAALHVASMIDNDQLDGVMEHVTKLAEMVDVIKRKEDQQKKNRAWIELMTKVVPPTISVANGCCPICTENYDTAARREAVFGQCGHCLCKQCGDATMAEQRRLGKATHCPTCRTRCDRLTILFRS
jgi:hypothetical protein